MPIQRSIAATSAFLSTFCLRALIATGIVGACLACGEPAREPALDGATAPVSAAPTATTAPSPSATPAASHVTPSTPAPTPRRALWVLCEGSRRVLDDPARIDGLIRDAKRLQATDLMVQVYRGGRAWYDASLADSSPFEAILAEHGVDTLDLLITRAHDAELAVHAWVNVLSLSTQRDAALIAELGRDAVQVDNKGRSVLDYPDLELPAPDSPWYRMGTRGVYLDPAAPGVAERLTAIFAELVERYPELDGLHLDYIRHPGVLPFVPGSRFGVGVDFGYGEPSRLRFQRETGLRPPQPGAAGVENSARWDDWRREKVTQLVGMIRSEVRRAPAPPGEPQRSPLVLSAAVISYRDRAYLSLYQDWKRWLAEDLIDIAVPMAYTVDDRLLAYQLEELAGSDAAARIWPGIGVWLFAKVPERALGQLAIVRDRHFRGEALFSYDSIADAPALLDALSSGEANAP